MQCYPGPKVEYSKANRGHRQSWLYKNSPIFVQNGAENAENTENAKNQILKS